MNLNLIDEVRTDAEHRTARYKNLMARQYDAMVKPRRFNIGDFVLKKVSLATKNPAHGKLSPNWEGPYRVINCKRQYKVINCKKQESYYLEASLECGAPEEVLLVKVSLDEYYYGWAWSLSALMFYLCLMLFVFNIATLLFVLWLFML